MKKTLAAILLSASAAASAMPTAVERGIVVQGGLQFQKTIVLDQTLRTEGGAALPKGSYEVRFESLPGNKVHALFYQGGAKRGEANGIIIVGGAPSGTPAHKLGSVGFGPYYFFRHGSGKHELVVGQQGSNQILIGLLLPAVQKGFADGSVHPGGANLEQGAQKVQPSK